MKYRDRYVWIGVGAGLLIVLVLAAFAPTVLAQSSPKETEEYLKTFEDVFRFIENNFVEDVDARELFVGALQGMFDVLDDPYSYFLDEADMANLSDTTTGNFGGLGLIISKQGSEDDSNGDARYIEVVAPIEGTPAYRAGISAGDLITAIEGESTDPLTIDEVVDRLRGDPGTSITVSVLRGKSTVLDLVIQRAIIEVPTVKSSMVDDQIGYVRIIQFTPFTENRVKDALLNLNRSGYKALIIDLRNNPGGLLKAVVDTADLFLSGGIIVSTRSRIPEENDVFTAGKGAEVPDNVPIIVLINKGSASASEILAGALRDNNRAVLVGETSFGKGSVQQVRDFGAGGFKLTTSRYYTPSGRNIDEVGIEPDRKVQEPELTEDEQTALQRVQEEHRIVRFVETYPNPSNERIDLFITELKDENIGLEDRLIRKLIRDEINRTNNNPPIFDLDYDLVLQEAVRILQMGGLSPRQ